MISSLTLEQRFQMLADTWRKECMHISSSTQRAMHPAYQQIIGLGPDAVPILLRDLQREPDHWSWALRAITGQNPIKDEHRGNLTLVAQDWIGWGKENGYLP